MDFAVVVRPSSKHALESETLLYGLLSPQGKQKDLVMRHLFLAIAISLFFAVSGRSDIFKFSYVFSASYGAPGNVEGTLSGTQVGDSITGYIDSVSVLALYIDGNSVDGPIYNANVLNGGQSGKAGVSFALNLNNFVFANSDVGNGDFSYTAYFRIFPAEPVGSVAESFDSVHQVSAHDEIDGSWVLLRSSESVPDSSNTAILYGWGLAGLLCARRVFKG